MTSSCSLCQSGSTTRHVLLHLTTCVTKSKERFADLEMQIHLLTGSSSEEGALGSGGGNKDNQDGGEDSGGGGANEIRSSLRDMGLIKQMEWEAEEAGLGG